MAVSRKALNQVFAVTVANHSLHRDLGSAWGAASKIINEASHHIPSRG